MNFRPLLAIAGLFCAALLVACDDSSAASDTSTLAASPMATTMPPPPPVEVSPEPQGVGLVEPTFEALPGATADFGKLGGAVYQIEMPDNWNGRLVLYMHGFQGLAPKASVQTPFFRNYLIRNGYAWGASSYSSTALIPGRAADETAALWDYFVSRYGRPQRTYVTGHSMGGAATHISAERYGNRYAGALAVCGFASQTAQARAVTDWFFAGAYAAGVTQDEFDASTDINALTYGRIAPALNDPSARRTFEDTLIGLTGGTRAFDSLGIHSEEATNWSRSAILVPFRLGMNEGRDYGFAPGTAVSEAAFDAGVIRVPENEDQMASFIAGNEITGDLELPMLTLHTTGDWQVPIDQEIILRETVAGAGKSDLLVQRAIRDREHCSTTATEWETAFEDLVAWVEDGARPQGEDLVSGGLAEAGLAFTLSPRFGDSTADLVPGAAERVTLSGTVSIDGEPAAGQFFWLEAHRDGRRAACSFPGDVVRGGGAYERVIAAEDEVPGCGAPGADIYGAIHRNGTTYYAGPIPWPQTAELIGVDLRFSTAGDGPALPDYTTIFGTVLDGEGRHISPGATIEAYVGDVLCGVSALSPVEMDFLGADRYDLLVGGPESIPGCDFDRMLVLKVDGVAVAQVVPNDRGAHAVDLVMP